MNAQCPYDETSVCSSKSRQALIRDARGVEVFVPRRHDRVAIAVQRLDRDADASARRVVLRDVVQGVGVSRPALDPKIERRVGVGHALVVERDVAVRVLEDVSRVTQVEPQDVERRGHQFAGVVAGKTGGSRKLECLEWRCEASDQGGLHRVEERRSRTIVQVLGDIEDGPRNHPGKQIVVDEAGRGHVLDLTRGAADKPAHHQRAVVLSRVGLGKLQRRNRSKGMSREHAPGEEARSAP